LLGAWRKAATWHNKYVANYCRMLDDSALFTPDTVLYIIYPTIIRSVVVVVAPDFSQLLFDVYDSTCRSRSSSIVLQCNCGGMQYEDGH
jgi:hypothetical protein